MPSAREIRRRIRSVKNIQQITKAMKMVAAARLRRAQERAMAGKPYMEKIHEILASVAAHAGEVQHPLLAAREIKKVGYLVIAADKGLAGAYSSNVIKEALAQVKGRQNIGLATVGRKARDYFKRRDYPVEREYTGFSDKPTYQHAVMLTRELTQAYLAGEYDEIHIVYTQFFSPAHFTPATVKLLPLAAPEAESQPGMQEYIFEPSAEAVLETLLPKYLETTIYGALQQAAASELGARMMAMGSATDNAQELISQLTLNYNKVRQATITREITEIVGGAEALK